MSPAESIDRCISEQADARNNMKLAYVAGPYRATTESDVVRNIREAEAVAIELWQMGYAVICPHKNTALFGGLCPDDVWLKGDLVMLERCDLVVMTPRWMESSGARAERDRAISAGIPVYEISEFRGRRHQG